MDYEVREQATETKRIRVARNTLHNPIGHSDSKSIIAYSLLVLLLVTYNIDAEKTVLDANFKQYMPAVDSCLRGEDTQPPTTKLTVDTIFTGLSDKNSCSEGDGQCKPITFVDCVVIPLVLLMGLAVSMFRMSKSIAFVAEMVQRR